MEVSQYRKQSNVIFAHFRSRGSGATRIVAPASERRAPRGHVRRQHRHDEQRWDDRVSEDVDASGIEQERVQDPLETEPHHHTDRWKSRAPTRLCEDLEGARRRRGCEMQRSASIEKRYRTALMITAP